MVTLQSGNIKIIVDEEGFLEKESVWNEEIAKVIAEHEGITYLDRDKMKIINFLRDYYDKHHNFPLLRNVCSKTGAHSRNCISLEFVDPMKAWKIAGLPKPSNIFFTSFDNKNFSANPFY